MWKEYINRLREFFFIILAVPTVVLVMLMLFMTMGLASVLIADKSEQLIFKMSLKEYINEILQ